MIEYSLLLTLVVEGKDYELHKQWRSLAQLHAGDFVHIDGLEDVQVKFVAWYVHEPGSAFVELGRHGASMRTAKAALAEMDYSLPDLP